MYEDQEENPNANLKHQILYSIKQTLSRDQIMTFVGGLHETQMELIEAVVASRERQGFPEASTAIKKIMEMR